MAALHVVCIDDTQTLWHTIRRLDGTWFPFGNVRRVILGQNPGSLNPGDFGQLDCVGVVNDLHVVLTTGSAIIHTIRRIDGSWFPFGDASSAAQGPSGIVVSVGAADVSGQLNLCAAIQVQVPNKPPLNSTVRPVCHTIRDQAGSWRQLENVGGSFDDIACAEAGGQLHFCGITFDSRGVSLNVLEHALRPSGGPFTPFGDVRGVVLAENPGSVDPGSFNRVSCAGLAGELHICATSAGGVFHTIRRANSHWSPFGDVLPEVAAENLGSHRPADVSDVSCAMVDGELHVICVDGSGTPWHTIRRANQTWLPFSDVRGEVLRENPGSPVPGPVLSVAIADSF